MAMEVAAVWSRRSLETTIHENRGIQRPTTIFNGNNSRSSQEEDEESGKASIIPVFKRST